MSKEEEIFCCCLLYYCLASIQLSGPTDWMETKSSVIPLTEPLHAIRTETTGLGTRSDGLAAFGLTNIGLLGLLPLLFIRQTLLGVPKSVAMLNGSCTSHKLQSPFGNRGYSWLGNSFREARNSRFKTEPSFKARNSGIFT